MFFAPKPIVFDLDRALEVKLAPRLTHKLEESSVMGALLQAMKLGNRHLTVQHAQTIKAVDVLKAKVGRQRIEFIQEQERLPQADLNQ
jgi:hypothetical protein